MQLNRSSTKIPLMDPADYVLDGTITASTDVSYDAFLSELLLLGRGFSYRELVRPVFRDLRGRYREPPREIWGRMAPTLALANELRTRLCEPEDGQDPIRGLRVAAAYRPRGGARRSQHKSNAALDLDLLPGDRVATRRFYEHAVRLWCDFGVAMKMGLGLYCPAGARGGIRVHLDTGFRCRTWQISRGRSIRPFVDEGSSVSLAVDLARGLGLTPPTRTA
ncbi:MAG: hypothetical protein KUG77_26860 [Nannocystaceae bacterium]|nr:hypothetical protein [Nannocystaceae bacterium]